MTLDALAGGPPLDLAIIGGGINGCAIAEEAAARGLRVALFEQDDFGFGTTWRSTKLIHGGLRYLEHGDVRLVFESLQERAWLLRTRRHLVRPQRFLLPILPWTRRPAWQLRAGLAMYDLLSYDRSVPSHRRVGDAQLRELAPFLNPDTSGGFSFYDARVLAPERLALELALEAEGLGAHIFNHARVESIETFRGAVSAVVVVADGRPRTIPARAVVNVAGPWVDAVNRVLGLPGPDLLGVTRGTHIAVELDGQPARDAIFSTAREDGRVFFSVPQGDLLLIGTTDVRFDGPAESVRPTRDDVDYLLEEGRALLPGMDIRPDRVRYAYAGLRPLQRVAGGPEAAITRRHAVIVHAREGGPAGLRSVVGGKLSTFRPLARDVVAPMRPPRKREQKPPSRRPAREQAWAVQLVALAAPGSKRSHLRIYGERVDEVVAAGPAILCPHAGAVTGEVIHAVRFEHARTLSDIMMRRTGISWASCRGLCCHRQAAALAAAELGWSVDEEAREVAAFEADVAFHLPTPASLYATP